MKMGIWTWDLVLTLGAIGVGAIAFCYVVYACYLINSYRRATLEHYEKVEKLLTQILEQRAR